MSSTTWVGAYLVLCWLLQMVLDLTNNQFFLLFLVGTAIIFIVSSLTHTHDMPAGEAAEKVEKKIETVMHTPQDEEGTISQEDEITISSGHRAPKGF